LEEKNEFFIFKTLQALLDLFALCWSIEEGPKDVIELA